MHRLSSSIALGALNSKSKITFQARVISNWTLLKHRKFNSYSRCIRNEHKPHAKINLIQENFKYFATSATNKIKEDHKTGTLTVWSDLKQLKASPVPALTLGLSGLLPFVSVPAYMVSSGAFFTDLAFAQVAYGACILSFIGGARWGFTLYEENPVKPDWVNLGYSVTPSLIAWCGLLLPSSLSSLTLIAGLTFAAYADLSMYGYPSWFKGLRFLLSMVAVLSLWTGFMCGLIMPHKTVMGSDSKDSTVTKDGI